MTAAVAHSRAELAAALILGAPLAWLLWSSGAVPFWLAFAAMALFVFVVSSAGSLLLRTAAALDMPAPAAWVLGVFATALAVYALTAAFHLLAATAFALWGTLVLGLRFLLPAAVPRALQGGELVALALCGAATVFWCGELAEVPLVLARDGVLATWTDQFIHGAVISQLGDPRAAGREAIELAGVSPPAYHYASYALPAVFAWPLDLPGLTLATSLWVPLGFLTACAGAYALGVALAGQGGGLAALGALTLLPDAAGYGLHNRLFGYYWYVVAVPSASYGIGVALVSIAFLKRWFATGSLRPLGASACLVAGSVLVRVHVFALALPAWLACVAVSLPAVRRRKLLSAGGALAAFALFVWAYYHALPDAVHALDLFLDVTHNQQHPTAYRGLYEGLMVLYGAQVAVPVGTALVLASTLGIFGLLYPLSVLACRRARALEAIDLVPPVLLACYLLLMVTAPVPPHGDATEFTQRPFVLVYAVFAVWTAAGFASWLASHGGLRAPRVRISLVALGALAVMWTLFSTVRDWRWAYSYTVAEGLPQAAAFMRSNWRQGDLLAAQGMASGLVVTDVAVQAVALTGIPAYLTRPFIHISNGGRRGRTALQRYVALGAVEREPSAPAALERLRELGIRWYVVAQADRRGPRWDPERRHAAFVEGMVAIYSTK